MVSYPFAYVYLPNNSVNILLFIPEQYIIPSITSKDYVLLEILSWLLVIDFSMLFLPNA